jgi:hypothetical protein
MMVLGDGPLSCLAADLAGLGLHALARGWSSGCLALTCRGLGVTRLLRHSCMLHVPQVMLKCVACIRHVHGSAQSTRPEADQITCTLV